MKKFKFVVCCLTVFLTASFTTVLGFEKAPTSNIVYMEDGSFYITTINESTSITKTASKSGTKTTKYVNASGKTEWQVSVTGSFNYNGSSSFCTKSTINAVSFQSNWSFSNKSATKSGNKATASATAKLTYNGAILKSVIKSVTLSCNANGVLS